MMVTSTKPLSLISVSGESVYDDEEEEEEEYCTFQESEVVLQNSR